MATYHQRWFATADELLDGSRQGYIDQTLTEMRDDGIDVTNADITDWTVECENFDDPDVVAVDVTVHYNDPMEGQ